MLVIGLFLLLSLFQFSLPSSQLLATTSPFLDSRQLFIHHLSSCCQSLVQKLPLPTIDEAMDKEGLNGLESIENFNMLKIDLSIYYERLSEISDSSDIKYLLEKIDNLVDLLSAILCCKEYIVIFTDESEFSRCKEYLKRVKFYGHAISYIIHRYEMEDIYFHGRL